MTEWTRLEGTRIWDLSMRAHRMTGHRDYHDWDRVLRMYKRASSALHLPYDEGLDLSILCQTVVCSHNTDRREQSIGWMKRNGSEFDTESLRSAERHIKSSPAHDLSDPRMTLLDLGDFSEFEMARERMGALVRQVMSRSGLDEMEVVSGLTVDLRRIRTSLRESGLQHRDTYQGILASEILSNMDRLTKEAIQWHYSRK